MAAPARALLLRAAVAWPRSAWRPLSLGSASRPQKSASSARKIALGLLTLGGVSAAAAFYAGRRSRATSGLDPRPPAPVARVVKSPAGDGASRPRLTLYQYQTCPFCCKVRSYLDYYGLSYDIVEVNSVTRAETRWSQYQKVPILCIENVDGEGAYLQINDSSVIVSLLHSLYVNDYQDSPALVASYYPSIEAKDSRDRTLLEYPNKYFVMFGERAPKVELAGLREEREWRRWADSELVHTLSPNIYRTPTESVQAFRHFSDVGGWEQAFSKSDRFIVVYIGAAAMYFIGKLLKRRHNLKDDVRLSLYEAVNKWTKALGPHRQFMGGDMPNLADLAVYGVLSSIEGCSAFDDMMVNTSTGPWYSRVKSSVANHAGYSCQPQS